MTWVSAQVHMANLVTANAIIVATIHGGAQSNNVVVVSYPRVFVNVGKNMVKEKDSCPRVMIDVIHQIFQSVNAIMNPAR